MTETELERAEKRYAQAKARLQALRNRAATEARKLDTRRKVILGGALVDLAGRDASAAAMLDRLVRNLPREQDRRAFEGWTPGDAVPDDGAQDGAQGEAGEAEEMASASLGPGISATSPAPHQEARLMPPVTSSLPR
ncbi:hypothetical protein [Rubellimicrobium rubrum]|uniref:hypothetical protein n=1 Tax=Rubellimicrobium rubrum TaxID=2585369 RepID=UPI001FE70CD8|nr:hypothetical protein [Rubellimicrobium rubrum]